MSCWIPSGKPARNPVKPPTPPPGLLGVSNSQNNIITPVAVKESSIQESGNPPVLEEMTKQDVKTPTPQGETVTPEENVKHDLQERYARSFESLIASYKTLDTETNPEIAKTVVETHTAALEASANPDNIPAQLFVSEPKPKTVEEAFSDAVEKAKKEGDTWTVLGN